MCFRRQIHARARSVRTTLLALMVGAATASAADSWSWEAVGIGGGGRFLGPGVSPHDPNLLLANSDMGGAYRSVDGGATWEMPPQAMLRRLHFELRQPHHLWSFHPTAPRLVFVGSAFGFYRSDDSGATWRPLHGPWSPVDESGDRTSPGPRVVAFDRASPDDGIAVFDAVSRDGRVSVCQTRDRGSSWQALAALPEGAGKVINALVLPSAEARALIVATTNGIFRSDDDGRSWMPAVDGLPKAGGLFLSDFDGAWKNGAGALYATATTADDKDSERVWLYLSADGARTWTPAPRSGVIANPARPASFGLLAVSAADPSIVYVTIKGGDSSVPGYPGQRALYRSDDGAQTWRPIWYHDATSERYNVVNDSWLKGQWGWTYPPSAIAVSETDPKTVFATTISSALLSHDGGETWKQVHAPAGAKNDQPAGGMMVTSAWSYAIHPADNNRRFIALTDFSGWRSADAGKTWRYRPDGNPWHNNTYAYAFDPERPDLVWAACSATHDIPTWRYQADLGTAKYVGGIVSSSDSGENWTPVDKDSGLPRKAVTDIWLDPSSPSSSRRLWAAVPGDGVFLSEDDARTWRSRSEGISPENKNVLRVKGDGRGRLYALCTVRIRGGVTVPGALYLSVNQGRSWKKIFTEPAAPFLTHVELPVSEPGAIYVSALHTVDGWDTATGGGVWKSSDGGHAWKRLFDKPAYAVAVDPHDPSRLYVSCWFKRGDGLHTSADGGATWTRVESYPFWRPLAISFDPRDDQTVYVTNFGAGVFRGRRLLTLPSSP